MTLSDLTSAVMTLTGRPDRTAETLLAIQAATLKAHQLDYFTKDIFETGLEFDSAECLQNFDYRNTIPFWRSGKYFRVYDVKDQYGVPLLIPKAGRVLTKVVPENILDDYSLERTDIWYQAGAFVQIKTCRPEQYFLIGCYVNPNTTSAGYNSWIADDHPFVIVYEATAIVMSAIGKTEEANQMRDLRVEYQQQLIMSNIDSIGY